MTTNIAEFARFLLKENSYKNRVLVLCEGEITGSLADLNLQSTGKRFTRSLKAAKKHDAHFYGKCKPEWWKAASPIKFPEFINAGSRSQVLETFFTILDLHRQNPQDFYLNPEKLFALVDLDIQNQSFAVDSSDQTYNSMANIEAIFNALYERGKFKGLTTYSNHILVTGLIHKEAYFLLPELQEKLSQFQPFYGDQMLDLAKLYSEIAEDSQYTEDLKQHFEGITQRLSQYPELNCCTPERLQASWLSHYQTSDHPEAWVHALFLFKKAKPYWERIHAADSHDYKRFQEQLCEGIAEFYRTRFRTQDAVQGETPVDHIPGLFRAIYRIAYETSY